MRDSKEVAIRREDHAECVVFTRHKRDDGDTWYEINVEDSYCGGRSYSCLFGRIKRAWKAFLASPIYYSGICVNDAFRIKRFLVECLDIVNEEIGV